MSGPGLESTTSIIVRRLIQDQLEPFNVLGMFPGQFDGNCLLLTNADYIISNKINIECCYHNWIAYIFFL